MENFYNSDLIEKLSELKETISEKTLELERSKGKLLLHKETLSKQGFKNVKEAKRSILKTKKELKEKKKNLNNEILNLERKLNV